MFPSAIISKPEAGEIKLVKYGMSRKTSTNHLMTHGLKRRVYRPF
jgi:hypothetical protein